MFKHYVEETSTMLPPGVSVNALLGHKVTDLELAKLAVRKLHNKAPDIMSACDTDDCYELVGSALAGQRCSAQVAKAALGLAYRGDDLATVQVFAKELLELGASDSPKAAQAAAFNVGDAISVLNELKQQHGINTTYYIINSGVGFACTCTIEGEDITETAEGFSKKEAKAKAALAALRRYKLTRG